MVVKVKQFIDKFYFTLTHITTLFLFSFPVTNIYTENVMLYFLMFFVIIFSTFILENHLNKKFSLKEKAEKFCKSLLPINIVIFFVFIMFIF